MKTQIYFFICIFFADVMLFSQTLMDETFQEGSMPSGWSVSSTATIPEEQWTFYDLYEDMEVYESSTVAQNEWVYLPSFDLKSYSKMYFNFGLWFYNRNSFEIAKTCHANVMLSTNNGATWQKIWSNDNVEASDFNGDALFDRMWSVNLKDYCGPGKPNVKLAFQYTSLGNKPVGMPTSFAALMRVNVSGTAITSFSNLTTNKLSWYPVPNFSGTYDVYYGPYGTDANKGGGTLVTGITTNSYSLPENYCKYTAYVRTNDGTLSEWTQLDFLNKVESISANPLPQSCQLNWIGKATSYDIEYGVGNFNIGNGTRISNVSANNYNLVNLTANTNYKVFIKASCSPDLWTNISFQTKNLGVISVEKSKFVIYPNPTSSEINFVEALLDIKIFDASGKLVTSFAGKKDKIDISKLSKGQYVLVGLNLNKDIISSIFIKN